MLKFSGFSISQLTNAKSITLKMMTCTIYCLKLALEQATKKERSFPVKYKKIAIKAVMLYLNLCKQS